MTPAKADIRRAAKAIQEARKAVAFTGAGISVESGLAPFRGPGGLWARHNPDKFHKRYFVAHPADSWATVKALFYDHIAQAKPNPAHFALAELEAAGLLSAVITQNVDALHHAAGSREVYEYHGSLRLLECMDCRGKTPYLDINLDTVPLGQPPACPRCGGLLKPDIVFFGEPIPEEAMRRASDAATSCDVMLVIGSTGEVQPASRLPHLAKNRSGATIIEVNVSPSSFTDSITDIFLQGPAAATLRVLTDAALR